MARDSTGFALASTLRLTSPQAAIVSISVALIAAIVALSSVLTTPCTWNACRVVSRSVPLPYRRAISSSASHCRGVQTPPGSRVRIMKLYAGSSFCWRRSSRMSRSSCW